MSPKIRSSVEYKKWHFEERLCSSFPCSEGIKWPEVVKLQQRTKNLHKKYNFSGIDNLNNDKRLKI